MKPGDKLRKLKEKDFVTLFQMKCGCLVRFETTCFLHLDYFDIAEKQLLKEMDEEFNKDILRSEIKTRMIEWLKQIFNRCTS